MSINTIIFSILYIITLVISVYIILTKLFPYLDKKNEIKDKEVKNKKYELFKDIDTDIIKQALDAYFEGYVNRYITYKFLSKFVPSIICDALSSLDGDKTILPFEMATSPVYAGVFNPSIMLTFFTIISYI